MSQTTLSKKKVSSYLFVQDYYNYETDEIVIPLVNAPKLKYCSFSQVKSSNGSRANCHLDKEKRAIVITIMRKGETTLTFRINGREFTVTIHVSEVKMKKASGVW